jgi:chromosome segregation ATPase
MQHRSIIYLSIQVAAKQRRNLSKIKRLKAEIDNLEEEKSELQDSYNDLKAAQDRIQDKTRKLEELVNKLTSRDDLLDQNRKLKAEVERITGRERAPNQREILPGAHRMLKAQRTSHSHPVGEFDSLLQDTIDHVPDEVGRALKIVMGTGMHISISMIYVLVKVARHLSC